ncbi:MAG: hypothetical protein V4708_17455 [Bacteroidota bacterium]
MEDIVEYNYRNNIEIFRPGVVGPVGAVFMSTQMKRSTPDSNLRWDPSTSGYNAPYFGSNVQDGSVASFTTGGGGARIIERPKDNTIVVGRIFQDLRAPDKLIIPIQQEIHNLEWNEKLAFNYNAQRTGNKFQGVAAYQIRPGGIPVGPSIKPRRL